jgi:hypothetical protein
MRKNDKAVYRYSIHKRSGAVWYCRASRSLKRKIARANIKYKDTLFTKLFNQPEKAVELYNALYGKNLPSDTPVEIMTLDDALFVKRKNDVAFMIDGHFLIFVEHQSALNENMPLRLLLYVVQEYEKILGYKMADGKNISNPNLYKKKLIKIPRPEFFVLYNGQEDLLDNSLHRVSEKTMRLSDAFLDNSESQDNSLELCVKVIDIRYSSQHPVLGTGATMSTLGEYSYFIEEKENGMRKGLDNKTATLTAVKHCIEKGILKDFLLQHETEVVSMIAGVYDEEMEKKVLCEEAEQRGRMEGERYGRMEGERYGRMEGERLGRAEGIQLGINVTISTLLDFGCSDEQILTALQKKLNITESQANKYLEQYYSNNL